MKDSKTLMVKTSVDLPKSEAYSFAKTMNHDEAYYIYKVGENLRARDAYRRENWVVCRYPRQGENVRGLTSCGPMSGNWNPLMTKPHRNTKAQAWGETWACEASRLGNDILLRYPP